uniref:DUF5641 domain-containing protein n=1 Tax=Nippostrongylus brasiliensis TaxID=27835 RepID=A0A0N4YY67_NIPBR
LEEKHCQVQLGHVPTQENSADLATRGIDKIGFHDHPWWNGPAFLSQPKEKWVSAYRYIPIQEAPGEDGRCDTDPKQVALVAPNPETSPHTTTTYTDIFSDVKTSDLGSIRRIVAYVLRFIHNTVRRLNKDRPLPIKLSQLFDDTITAMSSIPNGLEIRRATKVAPPLRVGNQDEKDPDYEFPNEQPQSLTKTQLIEAIDSSTKLVDRFWQLWQHYYLTSLREQHVRDATKGRGSRLQPKVGQVVLICEALQPRHSWKMGRIEELHHDSEGKVREALVTLPSRRKIRRPVNLLVPMELETIGSTDREPREQHQTPESSSPQRQETTESSLLPHPTTEGIGYNLRRKDRVDYEEASNQTMEKATLSKNSGSSNQQESTVYDTEATRRSSGSTNKSKTRPVLRPKAPGQKIRGAHQAAPRPENQPTQQQPNTKRRKILAQER